MLRELDLEALADLKSGRIPYPDVHPKTPAPAHKAQPAPQPAPSPKLQPREGPQTLIQPDLPNPITLPLPVPVPRVVLWAPSKALVKNIVPPKPDKPAAAVVHPSLARPNQEIHVADMNIASSDLPTVKLKLAPSTTSPVAASAPSEGRLTPSSASQTSATPAPAAILSLSDTQLMGGKAILPPVSESLKSDYHVGLGAGTAKNPSAQNGKGNSSGAGAGALGSGTTGNGYGQHTTTSIARPQNGFFNSITVGDAIDQEFPELAGVWSGRIAYTAYLHVGLSRSWIMQYSAPRTSEAAATGAVSHLQAPWPYNIVRPNLAPGSIGADALLVHGFVNPAGRFENLSVVFPQPFSSTEFVLAALQQWQFRPAMQNGKPATIEVLLIIPEQLE
jgi:hypothetical protein